MLYLFESGCGIACDLHYFISFQLVKTHVFMGFKFLNLVLQWPFNAHIIWIYKSTIYGDLTHQQNKTLTSKVDKNSSGWSNGLLFITSSSQPPKTTRAASRLTTDQLMMLNSQNSFPTQNILFTITSLNIQIVRWIIVMV